MRKPSRGATACLVSVTGIGLRYVACGAVERAVRTVVGDAYEQHGLGAVGGQVDAPHQFGLGSQEGHFRRRLEDRRHYGSPGIGGRRVAVLRERCPDEAFFAAGVGDPDRKRLSGPVWVVSDVSHIEDRCVCRVVRRYEPSSGRIRLSRERVGVAQPEAKNHHCSRRGEVQDRARSVAHFLPPLSIMTRVVVPQGSHLEDLYTLT